MNELHNINWGAVLAFVALLEFMRSVVIYMFISPLRGAGKKIDHLENQLNGLNFTNLQKSVDPRFPRILFTNNKAQSDTNAPALHETYSSFGNWTNSGGSAALNGGAAIIIGSNENWLVASGRGLGSVSGTRDKEYPTNRFSGFLAAGLNSAQSNQTFIVIRDQTNGLWCIGVDTNGVLGAYRTNDLSTAVSTY